MGLLKGNANFVEFKVHGESLEPSFIVERLAAFGFQDIDETYDEYSIGWVSVLDMFNKADDLIEGGFLVMSMRIDQRKIPAAILNKAVTKEVKKVMIDRQLPKLSRAMKVEIKDRIRTQLMRKADPVAATVEVAWNIDAGTIYFFSTNKSFQAVFEDLFKDTFGLIVQQQIPFTIALESVAIEKLEQLNNLKPCMFV